MFFIAFKVPPQISGRKSGAWLTDERQALPPDDKQLHLNFVYKEDIDIKNSDNNLS
jgi:hypothetical protein